MSVTMSDFEKLLESRRMSTFTIGKIANLMGVEKSWAIERRKAYLNENIAECEEYISKLVSKLAGADIANRAMILAISGIWRGHLTGYQRDLKLITVKDSNFYKDSIGDEDIRRAKDYQVEKLVPYEVRKKITRCFLHNDRNPSAGIKNNKFHCFVCDKTLDSIDIIMELRGLSFIEAVKEINGF